jgi:hypothetical protein
MIRHLRALFHRPEPLPRHVHYHYDDAGRKVFCDESTCRPAERRHELLFPPRW